MQLHFDVDAGLHEGARRLQSLLGFTEGAEGITVTAVPGDRAGVTLKDGHATIHYPKKNYFFRGLGLLCQHARQKEAFAVWEDTFFEEVSLMLDVSRMAVPTVSRVCRVLDYLAVMGYHMVMLYSEDLIALPERRFFGYMRGRYSADELRAMDDYADGYGIEMIPCLECYGHMEKYLKWGEASPIKDTAGVLLAREDKTFAFLEELISQAASCFRSRRIHIGMDEAWDMGRGRFLDKHGRVEPFQMFNEYMERLMEITDRHGLHPMMWSDMYFRNCSPDGMDYYGEQTELTPEVVASIPPQVDLVFWHYGEHPFCDDYMLKKHTALPNKTIYAGGMWSWIGHFPENHYMMETTAFSLQACRHNGVRSAMITLWLNDNAECDPDANLFGLSHFAELCYDGEATVDKRRERFEAVTGGCYDAFLAMSDYHNDFTKDYSARFHDRFYGKPLFWQDILDGLYDENLKHKPMSAHYEAAARRMRAFPADAFGDLYEYTARVMDYLAIKTAVAERLEPAYKAGDRETLRELAEVYLPRLKEAVQAVHVLHEERWMACHKDTGWSNMDFRYAGVAARCDTAQKLLRRYLAGEIDHIYGLDEVRLPGHVVGFTAFSRIAMPTPME